MFSEQSFEQLFGLLDDVVLIIQHDSTVLYANKRAKTLLHSISKTEQGSANFILQLCNLNLPNNSNSVNDTRVVADKKTFSVSGQKIENGSLFILRDITAFVKKVSDINESERLFRALFENSPGGILMMSPNLKIMAANKYICSLLDTSFEQILDTSIIEIIADQDRGNFIDKIQSLLLNNERFFEFEKRIKLSDNTHTTVLSTISVVRDDDNGEPMYLIEQMVNISKRKIAEQALRNSEFKFNRFFNSSTVMYLIVSGSSFRVIDCNNTFCENTSLQKTEIFDKKIESLFIPQHENSIKRLFIHNAQKAIEDEVELKTKQNTTISISITATAILDKNNGIESYILACTNIEKQLVIREELISAKNEAEKSDKLKSIFLSNMSHEIRTPMNGIIGFADLLNAQIDLSEKQKSFVAVIKECSYNLLKIIENIIDISKIDSGNLILKTEFFDLGKLLFELEDKFNKRLVELKKNYVQIILENSFVGHELYVRSDMFRVRQILNILFDNAVKFTEEGTITIGGTYEPNKNVTLWIKDTGIGIPSDKQDMIFERFRQVDERYERKYEGNGLGLAIVSGILKLMKGAIWLESDENNGSIFFVRFPI